MTWKYLIDIRSEERKNNAKFSGHYVRQRTHNVCAHALRSDQYNLEKMLNPTVLQFVTMIIKNNILPIY